MNKTICISTQSDIGLHTASCYVKSFLWNCSHYFNKCNTQRRICLLIYAASDTEELSPCSYCFLVLSDFKVMASLCEISPLFMS